MSTSEEISKKSCGGLTRNEVANLLQPVIELHGIEIKDDRFEFSGAHSCVETAAIFYKDITSISSFEARIEVLLQCGELYTFSTANSVRAHINTYSGNKNTKSEKPVTAQDVAGNIWDGLEKTLATGKK